MNPKIKFFIVYSIIFIAQPLALLFPLAWVLRSLNKFNPLWIVLDDSRKNKDGSLAEDYRIYRKRFKIGWLATLFWHVSRNRVYNLVNSFKVKNGITSPETQKGNQRIRVTKNISDFLFTGRDVHMAQDGVWAIGAGLKYVGQPADDPYQVNHGDVISSRYSIFGKGEIYYITKDGFKGWRKTSCRIITYNFLLFKVKRWVTLFIGMNSNRYSFKLKFQRLKPFDKPVFI